MKQKFPDQSMQTNIGSRRRFMITGATGFIGTALIHRLRSENRYAVRAATRREIAELPPDIERSVLGDFGAGTDWRTSLQDTDVVVHLAARVHVSHDTAADPLLEFRRANVETTLKLARQAAEAGVRRFIFLSSVKVNGEGRCLTALGRHIGQRAGGPVPPEVYRETDPPAPEDAYGLSKYEAETGLRQVSAATKMELVIIRPPLAYGPRVRANFLLLMRAIARGIPLPLGAISNRRSLVGLDNLVDFILLCAEHPAAANETFLVSDGEDLSTPELIRRLARAMECSARLIPVPESVLMTGAMLLGKRAVARRLLGSLQVDISKARQRLGWVPPVSVDEGLRGAVSALSVAAKRYS